MSQQHVASAVSRLVMVVGGILITATVLLLPKTAIKGVHADDCPNSYCGSYGALCSQNNCLCSNESGSCPDNGQYPNGGGDASTCGGGCFPE